MQLSFVLYSVPVRACFPSNMSIAEKQANTWMVGGRDPKKRKHFSFEFVSSEPKLKAKLSLDIKIFKAVNNVAGITLQWFVFI